MSNAFPQSFLDLVHNPTEENPDPFFVYFYLRREEPSGSKFSKIYSLYQFVIPRQIILDSNKKVHISMFLQSVDTETNRIVQESTEPIPYKSYDKNEMDWPLQEARGYWKHLLNQKYELFTGSPPRFNKTI